MAQWSGQYTGLTHATRVDDAEASLRHAVEVLRAARTEDREKQAKIVHALARRVLSARSRHIKARLVAAHQVASAETLEKRADEIDHLRQKAAECSERGVAGILAEFGAADLAAGSSPAAQTLPMKRYPPYCDIEPQTRRIIAILSQGTIECEVPLVFGDILSAEVRGDFIVAHTERGKASFHATTALAGKMPWHAMVKAYKSLCLLESLAGRVDLHITHHRYKSGALSRNGAAGRILIDGEIIYKGVAYPAGPDEFEPRALGAALATCLNLTPELAIASADPLVQALTLLDRRLDDADFLALELDALRSENPLWCAFHRLRATPLTDALPPGL